ncbi:MAG: hypothetical protein AB8G05_13520 [Oligoflexales bacterium]
MNLSCRSIFILIILMPLSIQCGEDDDKQVEEDNSENTEETIMRDRGFNYLKS